MVTKLLTTRLIAGLLLLLVGVDALAAGLVARLDRNRVAEGDAVVLTLSTSGGTDGLPDLTPLQADFDLINQGHSTHMRIVNGRSSSSREWHLTLMPKRTGTIQIPAISLGSATSTPLTLEVLPAAQAAKQGMPRPVLVEVDAAPKQPYVQQKLIYTVRLLFALPLRDAQLSEPRIADAIVEPLGEERRYETQRDGQQFQVVERRYAVLPQHSGSLTIGGPVLNARVPEQQQRGNSLRDRFFGRDPFAGFGALSGQTRPVQVRGQDLTVEVRPQPAAAPTPWLPAESLTLNEVWSPNPPVFRVGEPVTRTVVVTAQGLAGAQLPDLELAAPAGVKVYPDKSRAESRADKDTLIAQKLLKAALVPAQAGRLMLPEITLSWWDVGRDRLEVARLPAREIEVLPAPAGSGARATAAPATGAATVGAGAVVSPPSGSPRTSGIGAAETTASASLDRTVWPWVALVLTLAWLLSTALWLRARRLPAAVGGTVPPPIAPPPAAAAITLAQVERAFVGNDPHAAREALLGWARDRWPGEVPLGLETLGHRLGPGSTEVLAEIDRRLYAGDTGDWDGAAAWRRLAPLLARGRGATGRPADEGPLPPLYPDRV